jgi:hypothetical protein|uniref:Uncharacterized protein n=1 Tax=viral metagenome TaxID=1070528 RepID=A0A6C0BSN1_9ZZZZ
MTEPISFELTAATSPSSVIFTKNVNLNELKTKDLVKVRLTDDEGNGERFWIEILNINHKKETIIGEVTQDLIVLNIDKNSLICVHTNHVIDHISVELYELYKSL